MNIIAIWLAFRPFVKQYGIRVVMNVVKIAFDLAAQLAANPRTTPEERRAMVAADLKKYDFGTGTAIADKLINFAIEYVVSRLQRKASSVPAAVGIIIALALVVPAVHSATVTLPYINSGGYSTSMVILNPNETDALALNFYQPTGVGAPDPVLTPHQTFRFPGYPRPDGGIFTASFPDLPLYTEITDPNGQIARIPPISAIPAAGGELLDLITSGDFKTYLFLSSEEGSSLTIDYFHDAERVSSAAVILQAGETAIPEVPGGVNRAVVHYGIQFGAPGLPHGPVFALGLISHQPHGELLSVSSRGLGQ